MIDSQNQIKLQMEAAAAGLKRQKENAGAPTLCEFTGEDRALRNDIEVSPYHPANWLTKEGVFKKQRLIERKGLPCFYNWRFLTLTIDQKQFDSPKEAYLAGKAYMRNFMVKLRKLIGCREGVKWCWKLEFQQNGWPHWHLCIDHDFIAPDLLPKISKLWRFGRTNVERIEEKGNGFFYQFKYAFKPVYQEDTEDFQILPDWWMDYQQIELVSLKDEHGHVMRDKQGNALRAFKTKTLSRARFWQTSKGFYEPYPEEQHKHEEGTCDCEKGYCACEAESEEEETQRLQFTSLLPRPVRKDVEEVLNKVQLKARAANGTYRKTAVVTLTTTACAFFSMVGTGVLTAASAPTYNKSYVTSSDIVNQHIKPTHQQIWRLQQIQKLNQLTVQQVLRNLQATTAPF